MKNFFKVQRKLKGGFKVRTLKKKFISIMLVFTLLMAVFMPLTVSARTVTPMGDTAGENGLDHFSLSSEGLLTWTSRSIYYDKVRLLDATGKLLDHKDIDVISSEPPIMNSTNIINWMDSLELDTGKYTIMVHPWFGGSVGFGLEDYIYYNYTSPYEKLEAPVNLRWDGNTAKWDANSKATSYQLNIYDASGNKVVSGVSTSSTSYSYSSASNGYWFEVKAKSNSSSPIYRDSNYSESPRKGKNNVTFDLNGGTWTDAGTNPQVVYDGETAIRPTNPTKSGHVFAGWYADSACTTPFSFLTAITSNKTIYAKWNIITNSVNAILSPTPSVGLTIGDLVLTAGDSSKYSVSAGYWKLNDSGSVLDKSSTQFEAGQTYTLYLTYYRENEYVIPDDATYTVNGIPTEWSGFEAKSNRKISFTIPAVTTYTVSGSVTSFNDTSGDITLQLIPEGLSEPAYETTVKGNTVAYSFADVVAGTYTLKVSKANHVTREYTVVVGTDDVTQDAKIHLLGDINGDGKVTTIDFGRANSHARGVAILTGYELLCVDTVKQDGLVKTADAGRVNAHARGTSLLW